METYVQQGETIWKPVFHNYEPKCKKKNIFLAIYGALRGVFNDQTGPILLSSYPITHIYVYVK